MEMPKLKKSPDGILGGLKSKLGFSDADDGGYDDSYDDRYDDGYDGGYDDGYGDSYDDRGYGSYGGDAFARRDGGFGDGYEVPPISGSSSSRVRPAGYGQDGGYSGSPKLVSIDDVKARTAAPEGVVRDPVQRIRGAAADGAGTYGSGSGVRTRPFDDRSYDSRSAQGTDGYASASSSRSEGLNSLFGSDRAASSYGRNVKLLRPESYEDAEQIAAALRRGDTVVLDLATIDRSLLKRLLDFSFGAASMVDANVDCIAPQVFSVSRGEPLSQEELNVLRAQGVL